MVNENSIHRNRTLTIVILIFLLALAVFIRIRGLGKWCLAADEFYFSTAVSFIQEKGIPEFPSGGYYPRGIALQYLSALSASIIENREFAIRLIPFIFGVLTIPLFYLICRYFLNALPALLCAFLLLFSSWHIEFSRFGRMYAAFQFVFLLFVYYFYSGYWLKERKHQIYAWILAFVGIFFHEGGIFLPFVLMIPLFEEKTFFNKKSNELYLVIALLLLINYLVNGLGWRDLGIENRFSADVENMIKNTGFSLPIVLPSKELLFYAWGSNYTSIGFLFMTAGAVFVLAKQFTLKSDAWARLLAILAAFLPLIHQFGLIILIFLLFLIIRKDIIQVFTQNRKYWIPYIFVSTCYWFGMLLKTGNIGKTLHFLVGYPSIKHSIVIPFVNSLPMWSIIIFTVLIISVVRNSFSKQVNFTQYILMIILICIIMLPIFKTPFKLTRYSFFYFPLLLLLTYVEFDILVKWLVPK
jgi:hypothetical protein